MGGRVVTVGLWPKKQTDPRGDKKMIKNKTATITLEEYEKYFSEMRGQKSGEMK